MMLLLQSNKMKKILFFYFLICTLTGCKKEANTQNAVPNLYGYWQVDSITNIYGGNVRTSQMDTLYGSKINPESQIIMFLSEEGRATSSGYHYGIEGEWSTQRTMGIHFDLKEMVDFAGRHKSEWQPLVVGAFNDTETYRVEGSGMKNSQLLLYFAEGKAIVFCTKK